MAHQLHDVLTHLLLPLDFGKQKWSGQDKVRH